MSSRKAIQGRTSCSDRPRCQGRQGRCPRDRVTDRVQIPDAPENVTETDMLTWCLQLLRAIVHSASGATPKLCRLPHTRSAAIADDIHCCDMCLCRSNVPRTFFYTACHGKGPSRLYQGVRRRFNTTGTSVSDAAEHRSCERVSESVGSGKHSVVRHKQASYVLPCEANSRGLPLINTLDVLCVRYRP